MFSKMIKKLSTKLKDKAEDRLPMSVEKKEEPLKNMLDVFCAYCAGSNFVKRGRRQKRRELVQLYWCNDCQRTFTPGNVKGKHYPMAIILDAISLYHLGYSLEKACGIINKLQTAKEEKASKGVDNPDNPTVGDLPKGDKKTAKFSDSFGSINLMRDSGLSSKYNYSKSKNIVKSENQKVMEVRGIEPPSFWLTSRSSHQATPMTNSLYQKNNQLPKTELQPSSLANWVKQYQSLCAYHRMREFGLKLYKPEDVIVSVTLAHRQLYRFRYHRAKTRLIIEEDFKNRNFGALKEFLELVPAECPHEYFSQGLRASEAPITFSKTYMIVRSKQNYATKVAKFVLESVKESKLRHDALQRFMLANDSVTVATEVPVYIRREDLAHMQTQLGFELYHKNTKAQEAQETHKRLNVKAPKQENKDNLKPFLLDDLPKLITGHIDILQIRNGSAHILDYKPNAAKERPLEQLTLYALALSRLTGIRLFDFKCAWFDENDYFEFFPLHVVYKKKSRRKKVVTKEGVYLINNDQKKIKKIKPEKPV